MKLTQYYKVAENVFSVTAEADFFVGMEKYNIFATNVTDTVFDLNVVGEKFDGQYVTEIKQDEEGQQIICGHLDNGDSVFEFGLEGRRTGVLVSTPDYSVAKLYLDGADSQFAFDNAAMVLYSLATAKESTLLFHSAVVEYGGRAYMFLGKSGTGKSTHARLWLRNFPSATLLNDDNPVVRIMDDNVIKVFGSPWSGKTPCYKNEDYPLGAIVALSQTKHNEIRDLKGILAYAAVKPSISGKRWDPKIADALHASENFLAQHAKTYHLDCLPDDDAARICNSKITAQ